MSKSLIVFIILLFRNGDRDQLKERGARGCVLFFYSLLCIKRKINKEKFLNFQASCSPVTMFQKAKVISLGFRNERT